MEKIYIAEITDQGIVVEDTIATEEVGLTSQDYVHFISPIKVYAIVKRIEDLIFAQVKVSSRYASTCCRSLEKVERDWSNSFELDYEIDNTDETIDLVEDIRQEVVLRVPIRVLSDEEIQKDREQKRIVEVQNQTEESNKQTYQPFSNLKDID